MPTTSVAVGIVLCEPAAVPRTSGPRRALALCAIAVLTACTSTESHDARATPTPSPSPSASASTSAQPRAADGFSGDLIPRVTGRGSRNLRTVRVFDDVELYLQCTSGSATVTYGPAGRSTCPPGGAALIARVTAASYPASVPFAVVAEDGATWVLAVDSVPVVIENEDGTAVLSTQMQKACEHVAGAVIAQEEHDWATVRRELDQAWTPGHRAGDRAFAESVPSPGSIEADDTQTLAEQTDTLARRCGRRVAGE